MSLIKVIAGVVVLQLINDGRALQFPVDWSKELDAVWSAMGLAGTSMGAELYGEASAEIKHTLRRLRDSELKMALQRLREEA